jgi:hypothetical protein
LKLIGYDYAFKSHLIDYNGLRTDTYTIKATIVNQTYILEVLHLEHNIYVLQFYLKSHRHSANRFSLLLPSEIKRSSKHVFYLLNTIVNLSRELYLINSIASFGFMGAPTTKENNHKKNGQNINPDKTVKNTKRYRIYSLYVRRYFSPDDFTHISFKNSSSFLLMNNKNIYLNSSLATDYLNEIITEKVNI